VTKPQRPDDEQERLAELVSLDILDRPADERFDRITRLAQRLFDVPSAIITLVDRDRNWFLSKQGYDEDEASRDESFCAHAILGDDLMVVRDASKDPRFFDNPSVVADPGVRFYAGATIAGPGGSKLGTLCVFDEQPREISAADAGSLRDLAGMVEGEIAALTLAVTDDLTGLSNRRGFELSAARLLEVCRHRGVRATLLYLDLDDFKTINDAFGHDEGDAALVQFAGHLGATFRNSDVIARYGGDEFVVFLADSGDPSSVLGRLEEILLSRNAHPMNRYPMVVSIGTAVFTGDPEETLESLLGRADQAMFDVKRRHHEVDRET
jgi:diguanylate cyclase (GGDEF)-like protein